MLNWAYCVTTKFESVSHIDNLPDLVRVAHVLLLHVGRVLALQRTGDQRRVELLQLGLALVEPWRNGNKQITATLNRY